jgi:sugar fermentation stimulation protein A
VLEHRWPGRAVTATLVARPNKFLAIVRRGSLTVEAHVPDRGRCLDLLVPGREVAIVAASGPLRRTSWTCVLARSSSRTWVSLDPAGAPRLVAEALRLQLLPSLAPLQVARREIIVGTSRIDLLLEPVGGAGFAGDGRSPKGGALDVLCEVKSVGAAREGIALFPDAPTSRGLRHVRLLSRLARKGRPCAIVLCAQRGDVRAISPDSSIDPDFARALSRAANAGVRVVGLLCDASLRGMDPLREIPVIL